MSGRRLGGGRVLGSGKGLVPPAPAHDVRVPSPSDSSTVSLRSRNSTPSSVSPSSSTPLGEFSQDLASHVNLGGPSSSGSLGSLNGNRIICPICDEEMLTMLQLNRHIDDAHSELPSAEHDEVKGWLDRQVLKAKRFQPLSLINQKLRGLDVFESNETQPIIAPVATGRASETTLVDPEELVTRRHWQHTTGNDKCTDPLCDRRLGPLSGSVNCRKCGRLFCEEHTMYQMKLARNAHHDPVRGVWCRVCETCFKSQPGYNDHEGTRRDHLGEFAAMRSKKVERQRLEAQRLEKRLSKLTRLLAERPGPEMTGGAGLLSPVASSLAGQKAQRKAIEQSVVTWEDDASVGKCPFCKQEFGSWTFRRHHCRMCGRVVCADPQTGCSTEVGLNVAAGAALATGTSKTTNGLSPGSEKLAVGENGHQLTVDIRMCCECNTTIFSHRDFIESVEHKPPDQRAYETLRQFERGIRNLLPLFHKSLVALQPPSNEADPNSKPPPTHAQIQEAAKTRKRLTDAFAKYDIAARRLRDLKTDSETQLRLQKAVYASASSFLHANLMPLKSVPKLLQVNGHKPSHRRLASTSSNSPLKYAESAGGNGVGSDPETASLGGVSEASTAMSALETEEKQAREKLVVLEEQRFIVEEMLNNVRKARRFEEVGTLTRNLEELDKEIEASRKVVNRVEEQWEGLYATGAA